MALFCRFGLLVFWPLRVPGNKVVMLPHNPKRCFSMQQTQSHQQQRFRDEAAAVVGNHGKNKTMASAGISVKRWGGEDALDALDNALASCMQLRRVFETSKTLPKEASTSTHDLNQEPTEQDGEGRDRIEAEMEELKKRIRMLPRAQMETLLNQFQASDDRAERPESDSERFQFQCANDAVEGAPKAPEIKLTIDVSVPDSPHVGEPVNEDVDTTVQKTLRRVVDFVSTSFEVFSSPKEDCPPIEVKVGMVELPHKSEELLPEPTIVDPAPVKSFVNVSTCTEQMAPLAAMPASASPASSPMAMPFSPSHARSVTRTLSSTLPNESFSSNSSRRHGGDSAEVARLQDLVESLRSQLSSDSVQHAIELEEHRHQIAQMTSPKSSPAASSPDPKLSRSSSMVVSTPVSSSSVLATPATASAATLRRTPSVRSTARSRSTTKRRAISSATPRRTSVGAERRKTINANATVPSAKANSAATAPRTVLQEMKRTRKVLKDATSTWSKKCKVMDNLSSVCRAEKDLKSDPAVSREIDVLRKSLIVQIDDLRSTVVRSACRLLVTFGDLLGRSFQDTVVYVLPNLLSRTYVTVKVISQSSDQCIQSLICSTRPIKAISRLIKGTSDPHSCVRQCCSIYLSLLLKKCSLSELDPHMNALSTAVLTCLGDADSDVRSAAQKAFAGFERLWPTSAKSLFSELPPATQRMIRMARIDGSLDSGSASSTDGTFDNLLV